MQIVNIVIYYLRLVNTVKYFDGRELTQSWSHREYNCPVLNSLTILYINLFASSLKAMPAQIRD